MLTSLTKIPNYNLQPISRKSFKIMSQVPNKNQAFASPIAGRKKYQAPQRPSIQELKQKYESPPTTNSLKTSSPKSPRMLSKFKVKQMASMFNNRISQIIKRDTGIKKYTTLNNELSPETKPVTKATSPNCLPLPKLMPRTRSTKEKTPPVPSPRAKSKAKIQHTAICFVAEDVFAKLTVKEKALLYTQFIADMSKKNSKFGKHAELIEANVKKEAARGEVVNEKQESVKRLLEDLEARCAFPKQTISAVAVQRMNSCQQTGRTPNTQSTPIKSKEFEDIMEKRVSHISTLTVTLHNSQEKKLQRRARSLPRPTTEGGELDITEPSHKRNNVEMRTTLPIEAYAPPKKIRRSRAEHLAPKTFFQNQQLENLFYSWLKERHQNEVLQNKPFSIPAEMADENQKSAIDKLLEETIAKLESVEVIEKQETSPKETGEKGLLKEDEVKPKVLEIVQPLEAVPKPPSRKKKPAPAIPQHSTINKPVVSSESSTTSSTTSSAKHSETEESESGVCSLAKITTDESQAEMHQNLIGDLPNNYEFVLPLKPIRKKKIRRSLTWKKDSTLVEAKMLPTDSELNSKGSKTMSNKPPQLLELKPQIDETLTEAGFVELDETLMKEVNSPRKIKSAYTLTIFSPPPYNEEDIQDTYNCIKKRIESESWSSSAEDQLEKDLSYVGKSTSIDLQEEATNQCEEPCSLTDSFDQGFETGSNEMDSPIRPARKSSIKRQNKRHSPPLFIKLESETRSVSVDPIHKSENPAYFSTPIKDQAQQNFNDNYSGVQQQLFSPISQPYKNRRRSLYDSDSRRTSLAMQVIREDHPLENHEIQSPRSFSNTAMFFANAPTLDISNMSGLNPQKTSSFWIKSGDFLVSLDIFHNDAERLRLLYEIFSQKSCDSQDLHFGIDEHKFSVHNAEDPETISKRLPRNKENSHYWFATGDLAVPFSGKLMSSEKIQRLFRFIKSSVEETGILRFGVDATEFSNVSEFWTQSPKFSMESNYSILVGLQSGNSNGLEGRSKYAWPHSKPVPVSDLDQSDFECEDFEENESGRLSFSPFGSNHFDLASLGSEELMMPRNGDAMRSPESFYVDFENEPLDRLFDEKYSQPDKNEPFVPNVPDMLNTLQQQQQRLSLVQDRMSSCSRLSNLSSDALDALKGTPEYIARLKSIVSSISKIGCSSGFRECDLEQLERYMFFLSRYADICLNSCSDHMDMILDAMMDRKPLKV